MTKREKYTQEAINIAEDNTHGYSQANRWGPDYDCSSMVITVVKNAGIRVDVAGASYTGNMREAFLRCGFIDVTSLCRLDTGYGLQRGDILLNDDCHTAIYIGNNQLVHARSSEGNSIQGDQSGNEIRVQTYWNFPWSIVLRLGKDEDEKTITNPVTSIGGFVSSSNTSTASLPYDAVGNVVACIQGMLKYHKYPLGIYGIDGDSGGQYSYTNKGIESALANHDIPQDLFDLLLDYYRKEESK